jgi:hypothetical protein
MLVADLPVDGSGGKAPFMERIDGSMEPRASGETKGIIGWCSIGKVFWISTSTCRPSHQHLNTLHVAHLISIITLDVITIGIIMTMVIISLTLTTHALPQRGPADLRLLISGKRAHLVRRCRRMVHAYTHACI